MHVEVTNGLQKEKSALQLEAAKLARDVDLLRQAETLHLQRSSTQARCISGNSNKVFLFVSGYCKCLKDACHHFTALVFKLTVCFPEGFLNFTTPCVRDVHLIHHGFCGWSYSYSAEASPMTTLHRFLLIVERFCFLYPRFYESCILKSFAKVS